MDPTIIVAGIAAIPVLYSGWLSFKATRGQSSVDKERLMDERVAREFERLDARLEALQVEVDTCEHRRTEDRVWMAQVSGLLATAGITAPPLPPA